MYRSLDSAMTPGSSAERRPGSGATAAENISISCASTSRDQRKRRTFGVSTLVPSEMPRPPSS